MLRFSVPLARASAALRLAASGRLTPCSIIRAASSLQQMPPEPRRAPLAPPTATDTMSSNDPSWLRLVNNSLAAAPAETAACFVALDASAALGLFAALTATGAVAPPELALAYACARLFRRPRLPLDALAAAALARAWPALARVRLAAVVRRAVGLPVEPPAAGTAQSKSLLVRGAAAAASALDTYGLAFLAAQRIMGLCTTFALYAALRSGADVQSWIAALGLATGDGTLASTTAAVAGNWAAAVCGAAVLFPGVVVGSAVGGARLGAWRRGVPRGAS